MRVRRRRERDFSSERARLLSLRQPTYEKGEKREEKGGWKREATDRPTKGRTNERRIQQKRSLPSSPSLSLLSVSLSFLCLSLALSLFLGPFEAAAASFSAHSGRRRRCHAADTALPLVPVRPSVPPLSFPFFFLLFCGFPPFLFSFDSLSSLSRPSADGRTNGRTTYGLS